GEALAIYDEILPMVTKVQDEGPVRLGRAASYACMDSIDQAMSVYESVTRKFPRSTYASEAFYRLGVIYHEQLDSLVLAQESFEKSAQESSTSEFAPMASQKASSIKRLLELQNKRDGDNSTDVMAEKRFMAAEIQLNRLGETDNAMINYRAVLDSFPDSRFAPMAAYAIGYIYQRQKGDSAKAVDSWRDLVMRYPRSPQARGVLPRIKSSGFGDIAFSLEAFIDSAMADTAGVAEEMRRRREIAAPDSIRLASARQGRPVGPAPGQSTAPEPAVTPPARQEPDASSLARSGRFSTQMLKLIRRRKFDRMRREMWGDRSSPADSTSAGRT
ncbi:MAG TPA: tetratricopeptide repeat protein, partial [Candidatus Krumholzibacterium sp.]|nr:tetratricopeptide repeat protein [Candidatus Krumholzibacterium sp.]